MPFSTVTDVLLSLTYTACVSSCFPIHVCIESTSLFELGLYHVQIVLRAQCMVSFTYINHAQLRKVRFKQIMTATELQCNNSSTSCRMMLCGP